MVTTFIALGVAIAVILFIFFDPTDRRQLVLIGAVICNLFMLPGALIGTVFLIASDARNWLSFILSFAIPIIILVLAIIYYRSKPKTEDVPPMV